MEIRKINSEEEILRYYKRALICRKCKKMYGSDLVRDNKLCPKCNNPESLKEEEIDGRG